jgi:MoaA/NifB/PqqE/SkfB family radical SAM enzyme
MSVSPLLASTYKILAHEERVNAYLRGEPVYPVTLELGITARCNRNCDDCPSLYGRKQPDLSFPLIKHLLAGLDRKTPGLIITGGEPTLHADFGDILKAAREEYAFSEIAVITNGLLLQESRIYEPLMMYAGTVRVSLYDWNDNSLSGVLPTLERISRLRRMIGESGSRLQIGVSALTLNSQSEVLPQVVDMAREAGAHWVYLLPTCTKDVSGANARHEQKVVISTIRSLQDAYRETAGFDVFCLDDRYTVKAPHFRGYHAAHFIIVVGSDGVNYLGSESKYRDQFALVDLKRTNKCFLVDSERLARIRNIHSDEYAPKGSMNRGILYSDLIQKLIDGKTDWNTLKNKINGVQFRMVDII